MDETFSENKKKKKKGSQSHRTITQTEFHDTKEALCDKNNTNRTTSAALYNDDTRENV